MALVVGFLVGTGDGLMLGTCEGLALGAAEHWPQHAVLLPKVLGVVVVVLYQQQRRQWLLRPLSQSR